MAADMKKRWSSPEWQAAARAWIVRSLEAAGLQQTGPIEQARLRFWSVQLTVDTSGGRLWFKANNPGQVFEAGLVDELARIVPGHVVAPIAVEPELGWLLSTDQGRTMHDAGNTGRAAWERVVRDFGVVQRQLVDHADDLKRPGLPTLVPTAAPDLTRQLLDDAAARPVSDPRHADAALVRKVEQSLDWLADSADLLRSGPVPMSLEHNDLHANNTFDPDTSQPLRFFDFGDSLWSHPFVSMAVPVEHMSGDWEVDPDSDDVQYVLDAYLEVWSDLAPADDLRRLMRAALPFGQVHRLKSWDTVLRYADDEGLADFGGAVPGWLHRLVSEVDRAR